MNIRTFVPEGSARLVFVSDNALPPNLEGEDLDRESLVPASTSGSWDERDPHDGLSPLGPNERDDDDEDR